MSAGKGDRYRPVNRKKWDAFWKRLKRKKNGRKDKAVNS